MDWSQRIGRRLKPRDLHVFMTVAEFGNMAIAADHLAISRPVVSKTIADLEHILGVQLFDRFPYGVQPTPFGEVLARRGVVIFDELRRTVAELNSLTDMTAGAIRFACSEVYASGLATLALDRVAQRHPRWTFDCLIITDANVTDMLRSREVDLVISRHLPQHADIAVDTLFQERLVIVAGAQSVWAQKTKLTLADLSEAEWIQSRREIEPDGPTFEAFKTLGLKPPRVAIMSQSLHMRYALLGKHDYVTMIPEGSWMFSPVRGNLIALPVEMPRWRLPTSILSLKNRSLSPAAEAFAAEVREVAQQIANDL